MGEKAEKPSEYPQPEYIANPNSSSSRSHEPTGEQDYQSQEDALMENILANIKEMKGEAK